MNIKKIKTILVEDEPRGRNLLKSMLGEFCPDIELVGEAAYVDETVEMINAQKPDLLIMDIALYNETAFDALDRIPQPTPEIIFTTAYDNYAVKAFRYSVTDYLMKPIGPTELIKAIEKVKKLILAARDSEGTALPKHMPAGKIALPTLNGLMMKDVGAILYIAADGNYSRIYFSNQDNIIVSHSIKEYEKLLEDEKFFRIHKSYIINIDQVKKYLKGRGGHVVMSNNNLIPVAARRRNIFLKYLKSG